MAKNFKINACKACKNNYDIKDINNINQCCYDTLGAFEGATSINSFRDKPQAENCKMCVQESIKALGRDPCEFRLPGYPTWVQVPHYFPALLEQEGNVEKAKTKCIEACNSNRYKLECIKRCKIDADAVETVENYELNTNNPGFKDYLYIFTYGLGCIAGAIIFLMLFAIIINIINKKKDILSF